MPVPAIPLARDPQGPEVLERSIGALLGDRFQFGDPLEVFGATRGSFQADEHLETDDEDFPTEHLAPLAVWQEGVECPAPGHFAQQVQVTCPLDEAGVEFIVVGGFAATAHGSAAVTVDLDVVYARTPENIVRLTQAAASKLAKSVIVRDRAIGAMLPRGATH